MNKPAPPPSKVYVFAAFVIAVLIWAVVGAPERYHGVKPAWEIARHSSERR